jgi:hypothetical protein
MINLIAMHNQRFFSYLSFFTFSMVILVTGDNLLLLFVGWDQPYYFTIQTSLYAGNFNYKLQNILINK